MPKLEMFTCSPRPAGNAWGYEAEERICRMTLVLRVARGRGYLRHG